MRNTLDASHLESLLADDFHFASQWSFEETTSRDEYLTFLERKHEAAAASEQHARAEMAVVKGYPWLTGDHECPCVILVKADKENLVATVLAEVQEAKIARLDLCFIPPPEAATRTGEYPV